MIKKLLSMLKKSYTLEDIYNVEQKKIKMENYFSSGNLYLVKNNPIILEKIVNLSELKKAKIFKFWCRSIDDLKIFDFLTEYSRCDIVVINNWNEKNQNKDDVKKQTMELKKIAKRKKVPIIINAKNYNILWDYCHWYLEMDPVTEHITFKA